MVVMIGGGAIRSVLAVDDEEATRSEYAEALSLDGRIVFTAADGGAALDVARRQRPDLALVDLWIELAESARRRARAVEWGIDIARQLRAEHAAMAIAIVTNSLARAFVDKAREAAADAYLPKLLGPTKIVRLVESGQLSLEAPSCLEHESLARHEWEYCARVYVETGRNVSKAARLLEIKRETLYRKLREPPPPMKRAFSEHEDRWSAAVTSAGDPDPR